MSVSNEDAVRALFEATNRRDWPRAVDAYDDNAVLVVTSAFGVNAGVYYGREAVTGWFGDWLSTLRETRFSDLEVEHGTEALALRAKHTARGAESGVELTTDLFYAYWFRQEKVIRVEVHGSWEEARHAAGVRPPRAPLDLVRSIMAAWVRGDYSSAEWAHPEIESVVADGPSPGTWTGRAGMARGFRDFLSAWEGVRHEVDEYRALDGERVLVLSGLGARGKTSGVELGQIAAKGAVLFHVRDGEVTRLVLYLDRNHALTDLGLVPEADSGS